MDWLGQEQSNKYTKGSWVSRRTILGNSILGVLLAVGAADQEKQEAEAYSGVAVRKARSMRWKV